MDQLKEAAQKLKEKITLNPLEKVLNEATADVNWNASNKVLQEIADHTYNFGDFNEVMKYIWKRLSSERKQWRRILKTLTLIEYLTKNGSPRCVQEFKGEIYQIRTLQDFSHYEDGQDRGAAIREVSKRIVQLLGDEQKIDEERKKAQEMREKLGDMSGMGSKGGNYSSYSSTSGSGFSGSRYEGFSSKEAGGKSTGFGPSSYKGSGSNQSGGASYDEPRKFGQWRVEKTEESTSSKAKEPERDEGGYVVKSGTKYELSLSGDGKKEKEVEDKQESKKSIAPPAGAGGKKLPPPKGLKAAPASQQEMNLIDMDAPATTQPTTANTTNSADPFEFGAPQAQPQNNNIWNWDQGQQPQAGGNNTQQKAPDQGFNWNQAPTQQASQPASGNLIQNLYQQPQPQPQGGFPQGGFNFGNAPQPVPAQNHMNNLASQLGQLNFGSAPQPTAGFGNFGTAPQKTPTQNQTIQASNSANKHDDFDDFTTAKPSTIINEYKNYSQAEKSIIDLSDITSEAAKKKEQKDKIDASKKSSEGFLYSSKEDLDSFFIPPQPIVNQGGMAGGFNSGMMNQGMAAGGMNPMGGMYPMNNMQGMQMGMQQPGFGGMGGMAPNQGFYPMMGGGMQGGMQGGVNMMGGMQGGMNMQGGMQGGMNMQGGMQGFGNPQMGGGFGFR